MENQKKSSDQSSMEAEEPISLIHRGCALVRDLELKLQSSNTQRQCQPNVLSKFCDDILAIFMAAKERLALRSDDQERHPAPVQRDVGLEEWLRSTCTQAMELAQMQIMRSAVLELPVISPPPDRSQQQQTLEQKLGLGGGGLTLTAARGSVSGSAPPPPAEDFGGGLSFFPSDQMVMGSSSSPSKSRRRKDNMERRTVQVAAPRIGNTELPPEDGFTWRKYGQKEILGSRFPRGYFRCTHQKLYHCPAKKHVQRLDDDPYTFEVTYRGNHTCHMSSTAPSIPPPPLMDIAGGGQSFSQFISSSAEFPASSTSAAVLSRWLSMEISGSGSGSGGSGSSSGPSTVRYGGKEVDQFPVLDMADVMFNSGSCSSNSMDSIFPASAVEEHGHHRWEKEDKNKN